MTFVHNYDIIFEDNCLYFINIGGERMALTNVEMHVGDNQWKSITIDEAIKEYPFEKVSAVSGIFRCKLCKQFVTLTAPGINSRCFKHSRGDLDKDCDDRALSSTISQFEMQSFIPPIRIEIKNPKLFSLEMGFILPPDITNSKGIIEIKSDDLDSNVSLYDISRLNYDCLTYLKIGSTPSERYLIKCDNEQIHLSTIVDGIKQTGVLFDYITRKKLPDNGDVIVGREYILLTKRVLLANNDIEISQLCSMTDWYAYKISTNVFSKTASDFYSRYGYLLTEKLAFLTFLWPEYIVSPYVIKHNTNDLFLYIQGESITPNIFPSNNNLCFKYCDNDNGVAVTVECNARQQLLSAGRTKVLRYTYLWKDNLDVSISSPVVKVTDIKENDVISGNNFKLPEKGILQITTQFDGYIEINKDNWVIERRKVNANIIAEIDQIQYGMSINVFQGLDCVWSVSYIRTKKSISSNEMELLFKLQNAGGKMIPISHVFGAVANKFSEYPKIKEWIYLQIRNGYISENAYKIIRGK